MHGRAVQVNDVQTVFLLLATSFSEMPSPQGAMSTLDMSMSAPDNAWRPTSKCHMRHKWKHGE